MAILSELILYPIKSCAGIVLQEAMLTGTGLAAGGVHDREWMVVAEDGLFLTQREHPCMALVLPRIRGEHLEVSAPAMPALLLPLAHEAQAATRQVRIWDDVVDAADCGDAPAAWFSDALQRACRLVRFAPQVQRLTSTRWTGGTGGAPAHTRFADGYPVLLTSTASLADLNRRLLAAGRAALPMNRFRPNVVVDGTEAFDEDFTESYQLGPAVLKPVKPCGRCPIPSIDQASGQHGPDPLDILRGYRANPRMDGAICFGMNCIVTAGAGALLQLGQKLNVTLAF
jgi:uncharacterized protein YcbX